MLKVALAQVLRRHPRNPLRRHQMSVTPKAHCSQVRPGSHRRPAPLPTALQDHLLFLRPPPRPSHSQKPHLQWEIQSRRVCSRIFHLIQRRSDPVAREHRIPDLLAQDRNPRRCRAPPNPERRIRGCRHLLLSPPLSRRCDPYRHCHRNDTGPRTLYRPRSMGCAHGPYHGQKIEPDQRCLYRLQSTRRADGPSPYCR